MLGGAQFMAQVLLGRAACEPLSAPQRLEEIMKRTRKSDASDAKVGACPARPVLSCLGTAGTMQPSLLSFPCRRRKTRR